MLHISERGSTFQVLGGSLSVQPRVCDLSAGLQRLELRKGQTGAPGEAQGVVRMSMVTLYLQEAACLYGSDREEAAS